MSSRTLVAQAESEADVLDSLGELGESTVGELAADTGRTRDQVLGACVRLQRRGLARETKARPRTFAPVERRRR
jgi:DNA-binding IclR family transcriptional regulator